MDNYYGWGLPIDISTHGASIDRIIHLFHILMIVIFVAWGIFLVYTLFKFRARPGHKATYKLNHFKAPTYAEVFIALFEAVVLIGLSFPITNAYFNEMPDKATAMEVRIVAEQFAWNIHYPGPDKVFGRTRPDLVTVSNPIGLDETDPAAQDDIRSVNQFHIPIHKPVIAHLTSKDVIHSFFIPVMRVKHDMIPGQENTISFEANQTGKFEIACAQLCGLGHYRMRGFFVVETQEEFNQWLASKS